jgi:sugar lactone lactonase YvrE
MSLTDKFGSPATQISSITLHGADGVHHISIVTSDRLRVSDYSGRLLQVDSELHEELILKHPHSFTVSYTGSGTHTVTEDGHLLLIGKDKEVWKSTSDGTFTTLITTGRAIFCICASRINGDILVGSDERVTRYDRRGRELQVIEEDDKGQRLYILPRYITENSNGDIWTSDYDKGAVVVVDKSGRHRFDYTGRHSKDTGGLYHFFPQGICSDALGHVLVCDYYNHSVHLLDQDGQLLSLLLTRKQHGIRFPVALCVGDHHNLYLGQDESNRINVYKYLDLQDTDVK